MSVFRRWRYIPVVRTREAELKGLRELPSRILDDILPVVEITKSRRSKNNISAAVAKSVSAAVGIFSDRPFIADLTTLASQTNSEVEALLDHADGFAAWTAFVGSSIPKHCTPSAHLTEPFDRDNF